MALPIDKYLSRDYVEHNPTWDSEDSPWKAGLVRAILDKAGIVPPSICDVGCGAGEVLFELRRFYPKSRLYGCDVAPDAASFWPKHGSADIKFKIGDISAFNRNDFDVLLLLDVVEHLADPHAFTAKLMDKTRYFIFHFPLDLCAMNVLRETPILNQRKKVGHIHYFTKNLALSFVGECGLDVVKWEYSGYTFNGPRRAVSTILASLPRRIVYTLDKDWGVRMLGGETLVVLAENPGFAHNANKKC